LTLPAGVKLFALLAAFDSRHPLIGGGVAWLSVVAAWVLSNLSIITPVLICLGALFGALASFLTFAVKLWSLWRVRGRLKRQHDSRAIDSADDLPWNWP
jgi:hypothetical protein